MRQVRTLKRDEVKKLEFIYALLFEDLVIMFGKMVQILVAPGASFFRDIGSGFHGGVVLLGKVVDDSDDRSAPVKKISFFLIFPPFDTPLSLQSLFRVATSKPIILFAVKINDGLDPTAYSIQWGACCGGCGEGD